MFIHWDKSLETGHPLLEGLPCHGAGGYTGDGMKPGLEPTTTSHGSGDRQVWIHLVPGGPRRWRGCSTRGQAVVPGAGRLGSPPHGARSPRPRRWPAITAVAVIQWGRHR